MGKAWLIARHQFRQETGKRSFLIILFSLPVILYAAVFLVLLAMNMGSDRPRLGFVDQTESSIDIKRQPRGSNVVLVPFDTPEAAREALEAGRIDAYYVLPASYAETRQAQLVYFEPPEGGVTRTFADVVRLSLLAGQTPDVAERALLGMQVNVVASEQNRIFPGGVPGVGYFLSLAAAGVFAYLVLTTSGYMMEVVVTEKENRTMEVLMSSVSPGQMMAGKITGALAIAALQLLVWLAFLVGGPWLLGVLLGVNWLEGLDPTVLLALRRDIWAVVAVALPSYLFIAALMTAVGTTLIEVQETQQVGPLFFVFFLIPVYLLALIARDPNGPLAVGLSLFPVTSVMTIAVRSLFIEVPAGQVAASAAVALACGVVMIWVAGRAFRVSMLRYGRRLNLRDMFAVRRPRPEPAGRAGTGGD